MKIDINYLQKKFGMESLEKTNESKFDLNLDNTPLKVTQEEGAMIKSYSLCTPGCGNTGTGNSFCCR